MVGDSDDWSLFEPERAAYMEEFRGNVGKIRNVIASRSLAKQSPV